LIDRVVGVEARGFIFAPMVAYRLNAGFVPVRKPKKLPAETVQVSYSLEYGKHAWKCTATRSHRGRSLIIDDLLATGGTAAAVAQLVESQGGHIAGLGFLVELDFLKGREKLANYSVHSLLHYEK
jgi:adenine phosphoribosyltransferase